MSDIISWPWPRIILSKYKTFLVSGAPNGNITLSELFYSSANYWGILPVLNLGAYADTSEITIADFGPFYVVCTFGRDQFSNPIRRMYIRNLNVALGFAFASFTIQANPICGVCINFNGQFVGANIEGDPGSPWYGLSSQSVLWSAIGNFELDPQNSVEAGYGPAIAQWPLRQNVHVYKLMQLGHNLVAYSDAGPVLMQPSVVGNTFTYGQAKQPGLGILSGNHVAGDSHLHGIIDTRGEFWTITEGGEFTRRGYREFIRPILDFTSANDTRTIVSYIPHEQTFYISNGNSCLVINRYGAYTTHQLVASSVQAPNGAIWGTFVTGTDTEARITTDSVDFGSRGIKSIEALIADESHPAATIATLSVDWRVTKSAAFVSRPWVPAGPIGRAVMHTAGLDLRLRARFSSFTSVELSGLMANVKYSDQRFKRGTVPAQFDAGTA